MTSFKLYFLDTLSNNILPHLMKIRLVGAELLQKEGLADEQTDRTKLTVDFLFSK